MGPAPALRAVVIAPLLALLAGCAPESVADCAGIGDVARRETCRYEQTQKLALPDGPTGQLDKAGLKQAMSQIDDATSRDLILLRLAILAPTEAMGLCREVSTDGAREKCQQVLGRPHLGTTRKPPEPPPVRPGAPSSTGSAP